ncbi:MAG: hypothetical protein J6E31_05655, partial [Pyramidobacter sp.]|nr:hypothetical protein [Pyramidobacter sp.]
MQTLIQNKRETGKGLFRAQRTVLFSWPTSRFQRHKKIHSAPPAQSACLRYFPEEHAGNALPLKDDPHILLA